MTALKIIKRFYYFLTILLDQNIGKCVAALWEIALQYLVFPGGGHLVNNHILEKQEIS